MLQWKLKLLNNKSQDWSIVIDWFFPFAIKYKYLKQLEEEKFRQLLQNA